MSDDLDSQQDDGDDYYTFLNIPRTATDEDINRAYRRFSRLYHPDKHPDITRKAQAEVLFARTKRAYEVLSDPHMRAIYDNLGTAGLETPGWEVVERTRTPREIREEFERLAREREERRLQQRTNPKSTVNVTINATDLFTPYLDDPTPYLDLRDVFGLPHIEISGMSLSQAIEAPLTSRDTALFSGQLTSHNGTGSGGVQCGVRRVTSERGWGEVEVGAGQGLSLTLKAFRNSSRGFFGTGSVVTHLTPTGLRIGTIATVANPLDPQTVGYLTWRTSSQSGMTTMVVRDTPQTRLILSAHLGLPHPYLALSFTRKAPDHNVKFRVSGKAGTFGAVLEYGLERKVSQNSSVSATVVLAIPTGVSLRLKLQRATQSYGATILLCEEVLPAPVLYGTVGPVVVWLAIHHLLVRPYLRTQHQAGLNRQRMASRVRLLEKKREAAAAVDLMRETVKRVVEQEEARRGLVILEGWYGQLVTPGKEEEGDAVGGSTTLPEVIEVTIPLQCLVKDSKLILQESSKSSLPGFYDPCPGEAKSLRVRYLFHGMTHQTTVADTEPLRVPRQSHRLDV